MELIFQTLSILFWFIVILVPLVLIHEMGHLLIARIFGVKVSEFAVGMPLVRRNWYKKFKGIIWSFYWPILGGFVRILGDSDAIDKANEESKTDPKLARKNYLKNRYEEIILAQELQFFLENNNLEYTKDWKQFEKIKYKLDDQKEKINNEAFEKMYKQLLTLIDWEFDTNLKSKNTFFSKNWLQQTLIISGGVLFNIGFAVAIFWFIFSILSFNNINLDLTSLQKINNDVNYTSKSQELYLVVQKDSLADKNELKSGVKLFQIAGINSQEIDDIEKFRKILNDNKNKNILISYQNPNEEIKNKEIYLESKNDKVFLGVNLYREVSFVAKNWFVGLKLSFEMVWDMINLYFQAILDIFKALLPTTADKQALDSLGGPIAIGSVGSSIYKILGINGILQLIAQVSLALAVFNMLPVPALDGGRFVVLTITKILGKRNHTLENRIIGITFLLLMALGILIAFRDLQGVINGKFNLN